MRQMTLTIGGVKKYVSIELRNQYASGVSLMVTDEDMEADFCENSDMIEYISKLLEDGYREGDLRYVGGYTGWWKDVTPEPVQEPIKAVTPEPIPDRALGATLRKLIPESIVSIDPTGYYLTCSSGKVYALSVIECGAE